MNSSAAEHAFVRFMFTLARTCIQISALLQNGDKESVEYARFALLYGVFADIDCDVRIEVITLICTMDSPWFHYITTNRVKACIKVLPQMSV